MIYRMRIYKAIRENLEAFHQFFREELLPLQMRHGARLVGRWETEDARVIAIWEYDSREDYEKIEKNLRADPDSEKAQIRRRSLGELFSEFHEVFMTSRE